jgi:hypothetical protein
VCGKDGDDCSDCDHRVARYALGNRFLRSGLSDDDADVYSGKLLWQGEKCGRRESPHAHTACSEYSGGKVTRDGAETSDESDLETTLADDMRQTCISHVVPFELLTTGMTTVFEGIEVAQFAKERASCDDRKTYPNTPDDATENCDDLVAEEGREGYDEKYGYRNRPPTGKVFNLLRGGSELSDDLLMEYGDEKGYDSEDDGQHVVP